MLNILIETIVDNLKLFPFLFAAYLLLEYLEHKASEKTLKLVQKSKKSGPFVGALCGIIPQCGFSAAVANFYAARIVTLGTLIAVFLSTSDEMLPVMFAQSLPLKTICLIIGYKFVYAFVCGTLLNLCIKPKQVETGIADLCQNENCPCEKDPSIIKAALFHSVKITIFIFLITLCFNFGIEYIPISDTLLNMLKTPLLSEIFASLFGLIPNCSSSVILTQFYIENNITLSTMLSGTLVGTGVGILVLFRMNRNLKENIKILILLYFCGLIGGLVSNLIIF